MEDVLLLHHLTLHLSFQLLPFFSPFLPVPLQVNLDRVKIEQLELLSCSYSSQQNEAGIAHIPISYLCAY